ncbi:AGE family epimerase/isomerase [Sagittula sp. SSi028]|uniref:AGE family epimerase/isomerase n=1 Tax=Sagittula sp. SSi028 TaxID=3400636 RepID=UPI003AF451C6
MLLASPQATRWLDDDTHRLFLAEDARRQFAFFRHSLRADGGFHQLDVDGTPRPTQVQELHATTRMIHSFALGKLAGLDKGDDMIAHGLSYLGAGHHDAQYGGYIWARDGKDISDGRKLAYGHVFVLLAAASAHAAGHSTALGLLDQADQVLTQRFWEEDHGLFADEWNRDWTPFSSYRGMNANMHGVEALLAAFEATGRKHFLKRAGRILSFFMDTIAPQYDWRIPEHYTADWQVDPAYAGDPMFRPAGHTPGHSVEWARLWLQYGALTGTDVEDGARKIVYRALHDAWDESRGGGLIYTLDFDGQPAIRDRYWWPVTEAIGVLAALLKTGGTAEDEAWYHKMWQFADAHLIDHNQGGWFPELDDDNRPKARQFAGKPDIYHALQADILPLLPERANIYDGLRALIPPKL